jgi:alanine dehydrogenase
VGGYQQNPARGLPFISGMILLIDPRTGQFLAVMDGVLVTALRTGAQSAVPLKWLHGGPAIRLGLCGAGVQARAQTRAIAELFAIEALTVYDVRREAADAFAREMAPVVKGVIVVAASAEAAADNQVVICATQSKTKFLKEAWVKPGTTVIPMGSYQECEDDLLLRADKIIVDHVEQCLHRGALHDVAAAGKIAERHLHATIGDMVAGKKSGRTTPAERIICIPLGIGAHDIAVATVAYRRALERGLGGKFSFA